MIVLGASKYKKEIEKIVYSRMPKAEAKAWMKTSFHPETILAALENGRLIAFLQMQKRTFVFHHKKVQITLIEKAFSASDNDRSAVRELIEKAIEISAKSGLLCALQTYNPAVFEKLGFERLCTSKKGEIHKLNFHADFSCTITLWNSIHDLYPVYESFMDHFDGSLLLGRHEFYEAIRFKKLNGCDTAVCRQDGRITGFALFLKKRFGAEIKLLVYTSAQAPVALLDWLQKRYHHLTLNLNECENFSQIADASWKEDVSFMVKVHDIPMFERFAGIPFEDESLRPLLERPVWIFPEN